MDRPHQRERFWPNVALTLAALALFLQVLLPAGTMVARAGDQAFITICSGHGPLVIPAPDAPSGKKAPPQKTASDMPCAFAGHAPPAPAPTIALRPAPAASSYLEFSPRFVASPSPHPDLAAPPPPSHGPPSLLI